MAVSGPKTKLTLQRYADVADGIGGVTRTWSKLKEIYGVFQMSSGEERYTAGKITEIVSHSFYCQQPRGITITPKDRFLDASDNTYDILSYDDQPRNWATIKLKKRV